MGFFDFGGKPASKKTQKHQSSNTNHNHAISNSSKPKIVIGLIHAEWCGHCKRLMPKWKMMKTQINNNLQDQFIFSEIEAANETSEINNIIKTYLPNSKKIITVQGGYPTMFKIENGNLDYYKKGHDIQDMTNWFTTNKLQISNIDGGSNKLRKRKSRKNTKHKTKRKSKIII